MDDPKLWIYLFGTVALPMVGMIFWIGKLVARVSQVEKAIGKHEEQCEKRRAKVDERFSRGEAEFRRIAASLGRIEGALTK